MPSSDDVEFHVIRDPKKGGWFQPDGGKLKIAISSRCVSRLATLLFYMAHEMLHMHQYLAGTETRNTVHNANFLELAEEICNIHGWDVKLFT